MIRVGIIGARGYTGEELIKILLKHPRVKINYLTARVSRSVKIAKLFPFLRGKLDLSCADFNLEEALKSADLFFLCLPHTASMDVVPLLLSAGKAVIDLSADYRIKNYKLYEKWYKVKHKDRANLKNSVYGLPELYNDKIKKSGFIACPGCYPTASILALAPLLTFGFKIDNIIIDAKSGYSGAGKKSPVGPFWQELKDNFKAYKVDSHQHSAELNQELSLLSGKNIEVTFVPHLLPVERGILATIYAVLTQNLKLKTQNLIDIYKKFYKNKPFIRIKEEGVFPQLRDVQGTNFCDIGLKVSCDRKSVIIISAIDNLVKGASGQAVQNMNIICGFRETQGLL